MIALFSPSEGKNFLHYKFNLYPPLALESLSFAGADKSLRAQVIAAYLESLKDKKALPQLFGTKRIDEGMLTMCQNLCTSPTIQALRLYDGVAYQALDIENQETHIQNLLFEYVIVFSNLFGALKGGDKIPYYRLKQGAFMSGYDLKEYYANFECELDSWIGEEEVLDLRAEFYQKFYTPKTRCYIPRFYKNGKKLSHYAKLYRGHFLRHVASTFLLSGNKGWGLLDFEFEHLELIGVEKKDQNFILKYAIIE